jgi:hypothetical protein
MKFLLVLLLALSLNATTAQKIENIYKTWVLSKISYRNGSELPDGNPLKYLYMKYEFAYLDKYRVSTIFNERGEECPFYIKDNILLLKSTQGSVINSLRIQRLDDKLILLQGGDNGFDDPTSLLFVFVPEKVYQASIKLNPGDIHSVYNGDTTFVASPKIYANYNGESFQRYIYDGISDRINMHGRAVHFVANFIVSKNGIADSLQILESVDPEFDRRVVKIFNQQKKNWKPASLNGKTVNVLMQVDLRYLMSEAVLPAYSAGQKGLIAYNNKNFEVAEYYYDKAIESNPTDKEYLFMRGMCKFSLGNKAGACEDWNKGKALGSTAAIDDVLLKYCNK